MRILTAIWFILMLADSVLAHDAKDRNSTSYKVDVLAKTTDSWNGDRMPSYPNGQPEVTILKIAIPPHTAFPMHKHPVINAGVLLEGTLTIVTENNNTFRVNKGEAVVEIVDKWHYGKNDGNETAEIVVFYAGIKDRPVAVKKQ